MITRHFRYFGEFLCSLEKYHVTRHQLDEGDLIHLSHANHSIDIINKGLSILICQRNINGVAMYIRKIINRSKNPKFINNKISLLHFNKDEITLAPTGFPMLRFGFSNGRSNVHAVFNEVHDEPIFTLNEYEETGTLAPYNLGNAIPDIWSSDVHQALYQGTVVIINKLTGEDICKLRSIVTAGTIKKATIDLHKSVRYKARYLNSIKIIIKNVVTVKFSDLVN
jgi:hypothetical protein